MFLNGQNSKRQVYANSETKCAYKHTAKFADEKRNSASLAIHNPLNDERPMQLRKNQSDDPRTSTFRKEKNRDLHLESSGQDPKISDIRTRQR